MTIDLELRAAADELLEAIERSPVPSVPDPQRVDELEDYLPVDDFPARSEPGGRLGAVLAIAATVLLVVGVMVVTSGDDDGSETDPASKPTANDPTPAPTVTALPVAPEGADAVSGVATPAGCAPEAGPGELVATPGPVGWLQVCNAAAFDGAVMYEVVWAGPGLVAVGGEDRGCCAIDTESYDYDDPCGDCRELSQVADARVWTSVDGLRWSRVPHDEAIFGGDGVQQMFSVTAGGPGLVAVGRDSPAGNEQGNAAVWTSVDGLRWSRVPHDEAIFGGDGEQQMVSVTVGGPGLVAVGRDSPVGNEQGNAAVWTSVDGLRWSRVPHDEAILGGDGRQEMMSVIAGGPGLVAVGTDGYQPVPREGIPYEELEVDAAVWTSVDGLRWSRVPHDEDVFGGPRHQRMSDVAVGGPGLVAVGSSIRAIGPLVNNDYNVIAAVWTSRDGLTWSRINDPDLLTSTWETGTMLSVTAGGPGLVAVGATGDPGDQLWQDAVWTSPDGLSWSEHSTWDYWDTYFRMNGVTVGGPGLVAVGVHAEDGAAVWVTGADDLMASGEAEAGS